MSIMKPFTVAFFNDGHAGPEHNRMPLYEVLHMGLSTRPQLIDLEPGKSIEIEVDEYSTARITAE